MRYLPQLDGYRAVAVLSVMAVHSPLIHAAPGGAFGVDLFFVLSGFLITSLLLHEHETHGFIDLRKFYARRVLRLWPSLIGLVGCVAAVRMVVLPGALRLTGWSAIASVLGFSNWVRAAGVDLRHLGHTWSLAIEGQFYVIWPPLVVLLLRRNLRRSTVCAGIFLAFVSLSLYRAAMVHWPVTEERVYNGLDTRINALLIGSLVGAMSTWRMIPRTVFATLVLRSSAWASAIYLAVSVFRPFPFDNHTPVAVAASLTVLCLVESPPVLARRFLELPPLVWTGRISYGLYLWHFPVFLAVYELGLSYTGWCIPGQFAVAYALAVLSYLLVERRFLKLKSRYRPVNHAPLTIRTSGEAYAVA